MIADVQKHYESKKYGFLSLAEQGAESFIAYYRDHYPRKYKELVMINAILNKIQRITENFPKPHCYLMASSLAVEFGGEVLYDHNHCVFTIDNNFYDKRGLVDPDEVLHGNYLPITDYGWAQEMALINAMMEKHGK